MQVDGVIPANILPLHEDGSVDEAAYRRHLAWLAGVEGVVAVTCNGHAAEVSALTRAERTRAVALAAEAIDGRVSLIAGIHAENHLQAVELARDAVGEGADGLLVFPPPVTGLGGSGDMAYTHFAALSDAVDVPLIAFSYPAFTGMRYEMETLRRICALESVAAVKEWTLDIARHEQTLTMLRGLDHRVALLTSFSTNLLPALAIGADGILSGHGSVIAGLQARLFAEVQKADLAAARETYGRIQLLTRVIYRAPMANMYSRMKEHLVMLGHDLGTTVRPPLERVSDAERAELRQALVDAGLVT